MNGFFYLTQQIYIFASQGYFRPPALNLLKFFYENLRLNLIRTGTICFSVNSGKILQQIDFTKPLLSGFYTCCMFQKCLDNGLDK